MGRVAADPPYDIGMLDAIIAAHALSQQAAREDINAPGSRLRFRGSDEARLNPHASSCRMICRAMKWRMKPRVRRLDLRRRDFLNAGAAREFDPAAPRRAQGTEPDPASSKFVVLCRCRPRR